MKTYIELSLVAILIVLLYQPPISVTLFAKSVLGKALLIIAIVVASHFFGMNAGLLTSIIVVVLLNHTAEGFDATLSAASPCKGCAGCTSCQAGTQKGVGGNIEGLRGSSAAEEQPPLTPQQKIKAEKAATTAGVQLDNFSNYTLDNAADFANLKSTITALDTNENIKRSMRASEYAKTAPAGSTLMTNHLDTTAIVNNNSPSLAGIL